MGQILIRGLDDALLEKLKHRAKTNHRSAAAEVRAIVEASLNDTPQNGQSRQKSVLELAGSHPTRRTAEDIVAEVRALRDEWNEA